MLRRDVITSALFVVVVLAGCDNGPATPTSAPVVPTASGSALAAATSTLILPATIEVAPATEAPSGSSATEGPAGAPAASVSDSGLVAFFKSAGLPMDDATIYSADTDQDSLLGKPSEYVAKAGWHDTRLPAPVNPEQIALSDGGVIEIFADPAGAKDRMDYLQNLRKSSPSAAEYDYMNGPVLLRLSNALTPTQAADYKRVLDTIPVPTP